MARAVERPCTVQRELEYQFATQAASVDVAQQSTNYLRYYTEHIEAKLKGGSVCSSEVVFYRDGWRQDIDICATAGRALHSSTFRLNSSAVCGIGVHLGVV